MVLLLVTGSAHSYSTLTDKPPIVPWKLREFALLHTKNVQHCTGDSKHDHFSHMLN